MYDNNVTTFEKKISYQYSSNCSFEIVDEKMNSRYNFLSFSTFDIHCINMIFLNFDFFELRVIIENLYDDFEYSNIFSKTYIDAKAISMISKQFYAIYDNIDFCLINNIVFIASNFNVRNLNID